MKPEGHTNGMIEYMKHYRKQRGLFQHANMQCHLNNQRNFR